MIVWEVDLLDSESSIATFFDVYRLIAPASAPFLDP